VYRFEDWTAVSNFGYGYSESIESIDPKKVLIPCTITIATSTWGNMRGSLLSRMTYWEGRALSEACE